MAKKRGNHEGSIRYIPAKKLYRAGLQVNGTRKYVYAKTRELVIAKLDELRESKKQGMGLISKDMRLKELAELWINSSRSNWKSKTIESYWTPMKLHILPTLANKRMSVINNPAFLDEFFNVTLLKLGKTPNTVHRAYKTLHACLEWGVGRNYVGFNKCVGGRQGYFKLPIHKSKSLPLLSVTQIKSLAGTMATQKKSALWTLLFATGMRINEALGLSVDDLDFETNTITVRHQLKREGTNIYLARTKSEKVRKVPVDATVMDLFYKQLSATDSLRDSLADKGIAWSPNVSCDCCSQDSFRLAFLSEAGTPLDYDNLQSRDWKTLMKEWNSGIRLTIHDLRHIFASINLTNGTDVVTVSKLMGHANPSITLSIYASYINPPNQDAVASYMASLVRS